MDDPVDLRRSRSTCADGYLIWSERYDREMAGVFEIQDEIVESILNALAPAFMPEANRSCRSRPGTSV